MRPRPLGGAAHPAGAQVRVPGLSRGGPFCEAAGAVGPRVFGCQAGGVGPFGHQVQPPADLCTDVLLRGIAVLSRLPPPARPRCGRELPPPMVPGNADAPTTLCAMQVRGGCRAPDSAGAERSP